jgi:hypothetical protein
VVLVLVLLPTMDAHCSSNVQPTHELLLPVLLPSTSNSLI